MSDRDPQRPDGEDAPGEARPPEPAGSQEKDPADGKEAAQPEGGGDAAEKPAADPPQAEKPAAEEPAGETPQAAEPAAAQAGGEGAADDEAAARQKAAAAAKAKAEAAAKAKAAREAAEAAKPPWERDPVAPEWRDAGDDPLVEALRAGHLEGVLAARTFGEELTLLVAREALQGVARSLREEQGYRLLVDGCGAHYPDREENAFEVVYHLYSFEANRRVRLKVQTDDGVEVPTLSGVWRGANWLEREVWDMYGVRFAGHPDMTRILLWEGFSGHPLRKDFPVEGIETGSAIYPEYYGEEAGPVAGTGTGWKPAAPPQPEPEPEA